jgi:MOSC domain-containing protein YiiM
MRVLSVNVGRARSFSREGKSVRTAFYKTPVEGAVRARAEGLEGDQQADRRVHGGLRKAVYAYPSEHYAYWSERLERVDLPWGSFGENLTIEGLLERDVRVGDRFLIGEAVLIATEPRFPCHKLAMRFERADMIAIFLASGRTGFYLSVAREGLMRAGDVITRADQPAGAADEPPGADQAPAIADLVRLRQEREASRRPS